jgi:hypothetical protein
MGYENLCTRRTQEWLLFLLIILQENRVVSSRISAFGNGSGAVRSNLVEGAHILSFCWRSEHPQLLEKRESFLAVCADPWHVNSQERRRDGTGRPLNLRIPQLSHDDIQNSLAMRRSIPFNCIAPHFPLQSGMQLP